tara:strand:- start:36 stop:644 length:609 start_codon:yes stop_codon:yes gene_type:complete
MNGNIEPLIIKAYNVIIEEISKGHFSKEEIEILKEKIPEHIWLYGKLKFDKELKEIFDYETMIDLMSNFRFYLGKIKYKFVRRSQNFKAVVNHAPKETIPFDEFYTFDNIDDILLKYLSGKDEHLLRKLFIYYPQIEEKMLKKMSPFYTTMYFGKKKKKKKKLSSDIKKKCKKKGIRLTYTRKGKRIYKSEKVLRKQLSNRS